MPGEKTYLVLDENGKPLEPAGRRCRTRPRSITHDADAPGGATRWASVELAGNPPKADRQAAGHADRRHQEGHRRRGLRGRDPRSTVTDAGRPATGRSAAARPRPARGVHAVAHRCPCGLPDVVATEPRLPDGTPFPTTFYLTCPRAASRIGTLEGSGLMKEMEDRLGDDPELAAAYAAAHERYLAARAAELGRRARDRRHLGRRHARPGQVPARAGRASRWPRAAA